MKSKYPVEGKEGYLNPANNDLSRRDFIKKSMATAGFLALGRNKLLSLSRHLTGPGQFPEIDDKVKELINKMTLKEKVSQLQTYAPAIPRLGIKQYVWWSECLHGVARAGLATSFPQAIGLAATWDFPLLHESSAAISDEARAKHEAFAREGKRDRYMGLTFFAPNINLVRDPRWGRGQETYGEDPYLTGRMAVAYITGLQGDDKKWLKLVATSKHFAVYNGPEPLRHKIDVQVNNHDLFETYLPAFRTTIYDAGVVSVMCAYNSLDGEPCCGNNKLLDSILRDDWKFDGYVISDCGAIGDFFHKQAHHVVDTAEEAAAMGLKRGTDLNCGINGEYTFGKLDKAELKNLVDEKEIDQALHRLFVARYRLGLLAGMAKSPYSGIPYSVVNSKKHQQLALKMARESMVLLKNEPAGGQDNTSLLPLRKDMKSIAVIGPNADDAETLLGNYKGTPAFIVTPLQGIRDKVSSGTEVNYARGCEMADGMKRLLPVPSEMLKPSKGNGHGLYAEYFGNKDFSGAPARTRVDKDIDFTWRDDTPVNGKMAATFSVRWAGRLTAPKSGAYTIGFNARGGIKVYFDNQEKLTMRNYRDREFTVTLEAGKSYDLKVEYVNYGPDPQAHLVWKEPHQNLLSDALTAARRSDVVVLCLGLNSHMEGEEMPIEIDGFKGGDRTKLVLPVSQMELMKKVVEVGKPTVLVMLSGSAVAIPWAKEKVPAILQAWYGGQSGGTAIADVLFGDYNPGGRLPLTFYESVNDLPRFTDYNMDNRTYRYFKGKPLFPFGFGLSYTEFGYSNLQIPPRLPGKSPVKVSVDVTNTGKMKGDEVVQLYLSHLDYSGKHPIRALNSFKRISLDPGEKKTVAFTLSPEQFELVDEHGAPVSPSGRIRVSVGGKQPGFTGSLDASTTQVVEGILRT